MAKAIIHEKGMITTRRGHIYKVVAIINRKVNSRHVGKYKIYLAYFEALDDSDNRIADFNKDNTFRDWRGRENIFTHGNRRWLDSWSKTELIEKYKDHKTITLEFATDEEKEKVMKG